MTVILCILIALFLNWWAGVFFPMLMVHILEKTGDFKRVGTITYLGLPVNVWRQVSRKSWYARKWERYFGCGLAFNIILRYDPGAVSEEVLDEGAVHELRHHWQNIILGALWFLLYGAFTVIFGYYKNPFEVDARNKVAKWIRKGRRPCFGGFRWV